MTLRDIFKGLKRKTDFKEIEDDLYKKTIYESLTELKNTVHVWFYRTKEEGPSFKLQNEYFKNIRKLVSTAMNYALRVHDDKLYDELNEFYYELKKLPGLTPEFDKVNLPLNLETISKIDKTVEKLIKKYEKKYKPKHEDKEEKAKNEIPGIFVILLLSFLLFLLVFFSNFSSGYFYKTSDVISISLVFSFLLVFSVILLLRNL